MRIAIDNQAKVSSIGTHPLKFGQGLFLDGKKLVRGLEQIEGLVDGAVFLSLGREQIVEYLQWKDLDAYEAGIRSPMYRSHLAAVIRDPGAEAVPCEVIFVDDARPNSDQFDSLLVSEKGRGVTFVCSFEVQPGRREEFLDLLRRDHEAFLREMDGFIAVAFHQALHDENVVIEMLQFESAAKMRAVAKTPRGATHVDVVSQLATLAPNLYKVRSVYGSTLQSAASGIRR